MVDGLPYDDLCELDPADLDDLIGNEVGSSSRGNQNPQLV